jgi:osmotically-inducible protein OsmY
MTYKSDEEVRSGALFQLEWDSRLRRSDIGVSVKKGVVTLTGTVDSYAKKLAAQKAAHRVPGVLDVANEIEVRVTGSLRTDSEIAQAIRHALEWDVLVPSDRIHSTVANGWVTLEGEVEYYSERADAERAVSRLTGVRGVINNIAVCAPPVEPERMKSLIEDVLERRAGREAKRIRVSVDEGDVTLMGAVKSWDEKKAILGAVGHAPGVKMIHDHLFIEPYDARFESM